MMVVWMFTSLDIIVDVRESRTPTAFQGKAQDQRANASAILGAESCDPEEL